MTRQFARMLDPSADRREKALLVQVIHGRQTREDADESLAELERLADTAGALVLGSITQRRPRPTPGFFIGEGKLPEISMACREAKAGLIICDNELSPTQVNNLDLALGVKVIDRTELILQIFALRAKSAQSQIQVELAQLEYLVSRIPVSAKQQRFKGGIGMRGPGESPFSLRAEPMRRRIRDLKAKIEAIDRQRRITRKRRPWPMVSFVGYTNAGKSTLLNTFAKAEAYVDDRLFATLDTKTRLVRLAEGAKVMMTDTVGFIRNLPHGLVASFKSTLEDIAEADLLLHVADASHPFVEDHINVVNRTLEEIDAHKVPAIIVFNKCDRPEAQQAIETLMQHHPGAVAVSAVTRSGIDGLRDAMLARISGRYPVAPATIPPA